MGPIKFCTNQSAARPTTLSLLERGGGGGAVRRTGISVSVVTADNVTSVNARARFAPCVSAAAVLLLI